ncbi:outer membrane protein transport protein [Shigella flexneri]
MKPNLSGAYRLNNAWSFGSGFTPLTLARKSNVSQAIWAVGCWSDYAIPAGQTPQGQALAATANGIDSNTKIAHLNGNQWGFGWNANRMNWIKITAMHSPTVLK